MSLETQIKSRLMEACTPKRLDVINESHLHQGHAGDDGSGERHWRVSIDAPSLQNLTRIQRHRAIHKAIGDDILSKIHALSIDVSN